VELAVLLFHACRLQGGGEKAAADLEAAADGEAAPDATVAAPVAATGPGRPGRKKQGRKKKQLAQDDMQTLD
jgi:hypothetical protein